MNIRLPFGFEIRNQKNSEASFVAPTSNDGAQEQVTSGAGFYGYSFSANDIPKSEVELINRYLGMQNIPEVGAAIEEITTEAIVQDFGQPIVRIEFEDDSDDTIPPNVQEMISQEFDNVLTLLNFEENAYVIFRDWYVTGRDYRHIVVDETALAEGIKDIRYIDPRKMKKVREVKKEKNSGGVEIITGIEEYFVFNDSGIHSSTAGIKLSVDTVAYTPSGLVDPNGVVISFLHDSIKPANMVRLMEDATVITKLVRAPERRLFYIDIEGMTKTKAEQYMNDVMNKYRNKVTFNPTTGEVSSDTQNYSILEDFWLPRRCFSMDTKVKLLDGRDVSIEQLSLEYSEGKTNWTYSVSDAGKIVPGKITWAGVTMKNAAVVDVHLDNGEVITCTPDHKFVLRNGEKVQAQHLSTGASLMPCYTERRPMYGKTEYEYVLDNETNKWIPTHRMVSSFVNGESRNNQVVHHADFNRFNNTPENLIIMEKGAHLELHAKHSSKSWEEATEEKRLSWTTKLSESGKEFFKTEAGIIRRSEISESNKTQKNLDGLARGRTVIADARSYDKEHLTDEEYRAKWVKYTNPEVHLIVKAARSYDKEHLTDEEYRAKWVDPVIKSRKENHEKFLSSFSMTDIRAEIEKNMHSMIDNKEIVSIVASLYPDVKMGIGLLRSVLSHNGYATISDFICREFCDWELAPRRRYMAKNQNAVNHKVVGVTFREDRMDVGTLTVDGDETLHSYHNYALSAGVFVMNSNGKSTEISTLPGAQPQSMEEVAYYLDKLYKSLHVPLGRLQPDQGFQLGRTDQISREEVKFGKFIDRLRLQFSHMFNQLLRVQLVLKGILPPEDWQYVKSKIQYRFARDNYFSELKENEILQQRLEMLESITPYVGKYFTEEYVMDKILRLSERQKEDSEMLIRQAELLNKNNQGQENDN